MNLDVVDLPWKTAGGVAVMWNADEVTIVGYRAVDGMIVDSRLHHRMSIIIGTPLLFLLIARIGGATIVTTAITTPRNHAAIVADLHVALGAAAGVRAALVAARDRIRLRKVVRVVPVTVVHDGDARLRMSMSACLLCRLHGLW